MESIRLVARNGEAVRAALERGEVLHLDTARVLGALSYSVEVLEEGAGLSGQGTGKDQLYSGDVLRKLLGKAEKQAEVMQEDRAWATSGGTAVKGRSVFRAARPTHLIWMRLMRRHVLPRSGVACWIGTTRPLVPACWSMRKPVWDVVSIFWTRRR